jgi:hypothetical protein
MREPGRPDGAGRGPPRAAGSVAAPRSSTSSLSSLSPPSTLSNLSALDTEDRIALIGAGPSGMAAARWLDRLHIPFDGFEAHTDIGGLWDIANPRSAVCESTHPVTSKRRTEYREFPMPVHLADYPSHRELLAYLRDYATQFDLRRHFRFGTLVRRVEPLGERSDSRWRVAFDAGDGVRKAVYKGVLVANGTLAEPRMPRIPGRFEGQLMHAAAYKRAEQLQDRRVLVIGGGNSGCDIAVEAVRRARYVDLSVRRGMHFMPRHLFDRPADTWRLRLPLPASVTRRLEARVLRWFTGDPTQHGFPRPTQRLDESTPVVNPALLLHLGQGDLHVRPEVDRFDGETVHFKDGSQRGYDLIVAATGYRLHYPFLRAELLNWHGAAPRLYLNTFAPHYRRLAVLGMVDGHGLGWQDRMEQAELVARYLHALDLHPERAQAFVKRIRGKPPDLTGGRRVARADRLAHHVHPPTFRRALREALQHLR